MSCEHEFIFPSDFIIFPVSNHNAFVLAVPLRSLVFIVLISLGLRLKKHSSSVSLVVEDGAHINISIVIQKHGLGMRKMGIVHELANKYSILAPLYSQPILIIL